MRHRAILGLAALAMTGLLFGGCAARPPVDDNVKLQELVAVGQTIDQVMALMTPRLLAQAVVYPASNIVKQESGNWEFTAKSGGKEGDTDAPFVVIIVGPNQPGKEYLAVLFEDGVVFGTEWFSYSYAQVLHLLLTGQMEDAVSQSQ